MAVADVEERRVSCMRESFDTRGTNEGSTLQARPGTEGWGGPAGLGVKGCRGWLESPVSCLSAWQPACLPLLSSLCLYLYLYPLPSTLTAQRRRDPAKPKPRPGVYGGLALELQRPQRIHPHRGDPHHQLTFNPHLTHSRHDSTQFYTSPYQLDRLHTYPPLQISLRLSDQHRAAQTCTSCTCSLSLFLFLLLFLFFTP